MQREIKVYGKFLKMHLLSALEYKGWWLMCLQVLVVCFADLVSTFLMFDRFGAIGQWTLWHIVLSYSLAVTAFGLAESFCRGFDYFPWKMIRTGDFDRLLLRPMSLFTQVAGSYFHIHRLMRAATGLGLIYWAAARLHIAPTMYHIAIIALSLAGGMLMYIGVFVMSSGIAFFTIRALDWIYIFTNASYQLTRVPAEFLPGVLRHVFTFFMPMLVISYYPTAVLAGFIPQTWIAFIAVPAGALFLTLSLMVWRIGVSHYQSTGS